MPELDGYTFMRRLRRDRSGMRQPILAITAHNDTRTRIRALDEGAQDFLGKPFDRVEALVRIRNLLQVVLLQGRLHRRNVDLERLVEERTKEIERTRLQVIRRLARATEYRDPETGAHILRMSHYAHRLSRAVGFDDSESQLVLDASPMHDIGKVGIPDRILFKPGPLTPEEREIMETHTVIGGEILAGETGELLRLAREIALTHHERWDGTGYPLGLQGEEIPRCGRIAAICDVFDALTSPRPYRPAWSVEEALAEIRNCKGSHFEPALVEALMDVLPEVLEIQQNFRDAPDDTSGHWSRLIPGVGSDESARTGERPNLASS
jgi:putative two-component system response regulator